MNLLACEVEPGEHEPGFVHSRLSIRPDVGGDLIGCTVYELPPGEQLWPYHWHLANEEWAVVVGGTPTVRTPAGERELREGDLVAFVQGEAGAHTFLNRSGEVARVAVFSTRRPGDAFYPDSGKIGAGPPHDRRYFRLDDAVDYWEGERPASAETAAR
jgi:uncharacterized cupin superfamily protein